MTARGVPSQKGITRSLIKARVADQQRIRASVERLPALPLSATVLNFFASRLSAELGVPVQTIAAAWADIPRAPEPSISSLLENLGSVHARLLDLQARDAAYRQDSLRLLDRERELSTRLTLLHELTVMLDDMRDATQLFETTLDHLPASFGKSGNHIGRMSVMLNDEKAGGLKVSAQRGFKDLSAQEKIIVRPGQGIAGSVYSSGVGVIENNADASEFLASLRSGTADINSGSFLCVPIRHNGTTYGVLSIRSSIQEAFKADDLAHLEKIANILARAITRVTLIKTLETDSLTGFLRRDDTIGKARIDEMLAGCLKNRKKAYMIIFDLDHFKRVNDDMGHDVGDRVLSGVGRGIILPLLEEVKVSMPEFESVAVRYGGEEFVLLLANITKKRAFRITNEIRKKVKAHAFFDNHGGEFHKTISAGVSLLGPDGNEQSVLIRMADVRLYDAKQNGRDRVRTPDGFLTDQTSVVPR